MGKKLDLREVEVEPPRSGEVLIKMAAAGICHSDLHVMTGHLSAQLPAILGHEGSGIVAGVGPGGTSLKPSGARDYGVWLSSKNVKINLLGV